MQDKRNILSSPIEYLKGVGPRKGELLRKELNIQTFGDLLVHFPFRYIDKSRVIAIKDIASHENEYVQVTGKIIRLETAGEKRSKRLIATLRDSTAELTLIWFRGISWIQRSLQLHQPYNVFGKATWFNGAPQIAHPEIELRTAENTSGKSHLDPVYSATEKLNAWGLGGRAQARLTHTLFEIIPAAALPENIPAPLLQSFDLMARAPAYRAIHFPRDQEELRQAQLRLKFEEFFLAQIGLLRIKMNRHRLSKGWSFEKVGHCFNTYYHDHLPFELTAAQKRVLREIREDTRSGRQMNRLLQGDVGSGKTAVALLSMLLAIDNGFQACMMAPTSILAQQHYQHIAPAVAQIGLRTALLTGNVKGKKRKDILAAAADGTLDIMIGTHALIEETVVFKNLGLAVIDEQHRFGVEQRARLWAKNELPPHILVMTATPIPRTLAMTIYGDLDVSVIDELPPGRKEIVTVHRHENQRAHVMNFIREEIKKGRQAYIVYPLIEESAKLDFENLMTGFEQVNGYFPEPDYYISMVHGKQKANIKAANMQRFASGDCQIMVATTVIEVGVNVPNATVMLIESAERFGLSQLHQLRGRVGRGGEKSYCILMTGEKLGKDSRLRMNVMVESNNGFLIAEKDMELRGPGDIEGTRQSGALNLHIADVIADKAILMAARKAAEGLLETDPALEQPDNQCLKNYLLQQKDKNIWSRIS